MKDTIIIDINENDIDYEEGLKYSSEKVRNDMLKACEILQAGGLVAFPTETVYGLGGDALNADASKKIYAAKGRPSDNPLIVHISKISDVEKLVSEISENASKLMNAFWPGPMTLVFEKKDIVPNETTGGLDTVAIRLPSHKVARALIEESGVFIAAPSANISGRPSPTKGSHVIEDMEGRIDAIIDGGDVGIGLESTIIDATGEMPVILRPGYITEDMIKDVCGQSMIDPAILRKPEEGLRPKAPGMKYKHYAPKADFTLYQGEDAKVFESICKNALKEISEGKVVGIIATKENINEYCKRLSVTYTIKNDEKADFREKLVKRTDNRLFIIEIGSKFSEESIAKNLFAVLREFDSLEVDVILGETFSEEGLGRAIMNRLSKACGYDICDVN